MKTPPVPSSEAARLAALGDYEILDTGPEKAFDTLTQLAARLLDMPISLVSLVDAHRQWFKSRHGLDVEQTPREISFCGHVVADGRALVVRDTLADPRFADNPLVVDGPRIRFYAGMPLRSATGMVLGTLCAIDRRPRTLTREQLELLELLAAQVVDQLELRRRYHAMQSAEARLAVAESRAATLLDAMFEGVVVRDARGLIVECNRAAASILGVDPERVVGLSAMEGAWEMLRGDGSPYPRDEYPAMLSLRSGEPVRRRMMGLQRADGELRWLEVSARPLRDPATGALTGVVSTFADVTREHAAVAQLAAERRFLETVLAGLPGTQVAVIDAERRIVRAFGPLNAIASDATGERLVGMPISALLSPASQPELDAAVSRCLSGESAQFFASRDSRHFDVRLVPFASGASAATSGLMIAHDVTELDALHEQMTRQAQLATMGTLSAGVGHEINNPLQYVLGNLDFALAQLLEMADDSPSPHLAEVCRALADARGGGERIREIVQGLRALVRRAATPTAIDVHATVRVACSMCMHEVRQRATLSFEFDPVGSVMGDEARLSQIVVNLVVNAAQAFLPSDPDRNRITVRTRRVDDGVRIEVADNGPGVATVDRARIFEPFYTTKPPGEGTGLGLAICQSLAASLGTEIRCDDTPGGGATFSLVLPTGQPMPSGVGFVRTPLPARRRGRVLVVDDEPAIARLTARLLEAEHEVVAFSDARQALDAMLAPGARFDVVLCDVMMPYLNGVELFQAAQAHAPGLAPRFVFISGGAPREELRAFIESLPNERLDKPFRGDQLRALLRRFVDDERGHAPATVIVANQ